MIDMSLKVKAQEDLLDIVRSVLMKKSLITSKSFFHVHHRKLPIRMVNNHLGRHRKSLFVRLQEIEHRSFALLHPAVACVSVAPKKSKTEK